MTPGHRLRVRCRALLLFPLLLAAALAGLAEPPDASTVTASSATQYTLHAYANLIQLPVLVLSPARERLKKAIPADRFVISIDSGPWFRATHARPEGDDPISLSILIDARGQEGTLTNHIEDALAALAPTSLHATDTASVYSLDCGLSRGLNNTQVDSNNLHDGAVAALAPWRTRLATRGRCAQNVSLQESLLYVISERNKLPGRRVVLVLSSGSNESHGVSWRTISEAAQTGGTALFAIAPQIPASLGWHNPGLTAGLPSNNSEAELEAACELTGGMLLRTSGKGVQSALTEVATMLRERYIVDFPRPANATAGRHVIEIQVQKSAAFVRPAGISVPIADPATLADPTTVPSDATLAPVQGKRVPLPR